MFECQGLYSIAKKVCSCLLKDCAETCAVPLQVRANHFPVECKLRQAVHYDVSILGRPRTRGHAGGEETVHESAGPQAPGSVKPLPQDTCWCAAPLTSSLQCVSMHNGIGTAWYGLPLNGPVIEQRGSHHQCDAVCKASSALRKMPVCMHCFSLHSR